MQIPTSESLGFGITRIDAGYIRPGIACFYLVESDGEFAVIETGTSFSSAALEQLMSERGIAAGQMRYVIPTHVHLDHAGGAGTMMAAFDAAQLLIHPRGARHMADPERLVESSMQVYGESEFYKRYGEIMPIDGNRIAAVDDGDEIRLGTRRLQFRHTRGHAEHHVCIWDETSRGWFSGDMFGICYPWFRSADGDFLLPTTTPTQFDPDAYLESLELLASYNPARIYLTHYGEIAFTVDKQHQLVEQVRQYAALAVTSADDVAGLEEKLTRYTLGLMVESGFEQSEERLRQMLAMDMDLNAQGVTVWLQRSGKLPV